MRCTLLRQYPKLGLVILAAACDEGTKPKPPHPVTFNSIAAGGMHTCGLGADSLAYCWGYNRSGEVGDGTSENRAAPVPVTKRLRFVAIGSGSNHTCALTSSGTAYCWGANDKGQLGDGSASNRSAPVAVSASVAFASTRQAAITPARCRCRAKRGAGAETTTDSLAMGSLHHSQLPRQSRATFDSLLSLPARPTLAESRRMVRRIAGAQTRRESWATVR